MPENAPTPSPAVDQYLSTVSEEQRAALQHVRELIRSRLPRAQECISYGVPAFRLEKVLIGYGATAGHCALYTMSGTTLEAFKDALSGFKLSRGTVRFQPDSLIPDDMIVRLLEARLAECAGGSKA